jgi:3-isopropylmalate/(R)-2-methylmalate dehydratase small subunit
MQPMRTHHGQVIPLDRANVDTDQIIPKQFLKRIERTGFGKYLFFDWRFRDDGSDNPEFELNRPEFRGASVLLARRNYGCGSSREHAPWALVDFGITCVIAPSFADIFYTNCFKNGLLPIALPQDIVDQLMEDAKKGANAVLTIDLEAQTISRPDGGVVKFDIDPFRKHCMLNGLDDIGLTEQKDSEIATYEREARLTRPWLFGMTQAGT